MLQGDQSNPQQEAFHNLFTAGSNNKSHPGDKTAHFQGLPVAINQIFDKVIVEH